MSDAIRGASSLRQRARRSCAFFRWWRRWTILSLCVQWTDNQKNSLIRKTFSLNRDSWTRIGYLVEEKEEKWHALSISPSSNRLITWGEFNFKWHQICLLNTQSEIDGLAPSTGTSLLRERRRDWCRDLCIHRMELIPLDMTCKYRSIEQDATNVQSSVII